MRISEAPLRAGSVAWIAVFGTLYALHGRPHQGSLAPGRSTALPRLRPVTR